MILACEIDGGLNLVNHPLVFHLERLRIRLGKIGFLDTMGQLKYDADDQADCPGGKQVEQANHPKRVEECGNHEKQGEKEKQEAFEFGGFNFAAESLSLIDNIDRAITSFKNDESLKNNKDLDKIIDSIEIVKKDLVSIFKKNGIVPIECINKKFDPNFHQAMIEVENNTKEPGTVVQEIQKGYLMKDRLLRPSLVGVAKKREENIKNGEKKIFN